MAIKWKIIKWLHNKMWKRSRVINTIVLSKRNSYPALIWFEILPPVGASRVFHECTYWPFAFLLHNVKKGY